MHVYVSIYINMKNNGIFKDVSVGLASPANVK